LELRDAIGREVELRATPGRIVSLVPSLTETLFALGAGPHVVGVTDFCVHPADEVQRRRRVGGTKTPRLEAILELAPDLVLASKEENRRRDVEALERAGIPVYVTYPRTVHAAALDIELLGRILACPERADAIVGAVEQARARARERAPRPAPRVVALIWKQPYMTLNADTFGHDMLVQSGGSNPFASAERRYPRTDESGLGAAAPEVILLPTEPYAFGERDRQELLRLDCPAAASGRIHIVEGELLSWYGPRMARALEVFSELLRGRSPAPPLRLVPPGPPPSPGRRGR
jgi:ABC-type Fe3+-hydroxamate transport system substrate-binding protein